MPPVDALKTALDAARLGGQILMEHLEGPLEIREKGRRADLVTLADGASERAVVERLRADFPNASFLGEEGGLQSGESRERWIIDPLDGTTNFAHGYPIFCVSIAFEREGEVIAAVIYAPAMNELFVAERGSGVTLNDLPIRVSAIGSMAASLVCTGFQPAHYERNMQYFDAASKTTQGVRRDGSAALNLAYVACRRFDAFWEFDLHEWDTAAGALMVREAGGRCSTIEGGDWSLTSKSVLASNGIVHDEFVRMFSKVT
ncbi:MAG TPA: inositol monophosphatase family protein [Candidatus Rubrimentiphilum sp.]|nr:inositol monophosphatase family protein [Candidatus Rubrimentiphilum sp.]